MLFVLVRAATWSTLFIGIVLWMVPGTLLAAAGIRAPASFGVPQAAGLVIGLAGLAVAASCIVTFVLVGRGTPAPFDPPRRLVARGPYHLVRNPMYLGAWLFLVGLALFYRSVGVAVYALAFLATAHAFVVLYEEPTLRRTFGGEYDAYCRRAGRWLPMSGHHT